MARSHDRAFRPSLPVIAGAAAHRAMRAAGYKEHGAPSEVFGTVEADT